jgi:hypothetical protein
MAKSKRKQKKSKPKAPAHRRQRERRFQPSQTHTSAVSVGVGMLGAVALGAGVWAQWLSEQEHGFAPYLVAGGALALAAALWFGDVGTHPVRVGDAGVAIEKGTEIVRLLWCDIQRIFVDRRALVVESDDVVLRIPLGAHPQAASWILAEGTRRVPDAMDVKPSVADALPAPRPRDGELKKVAAYQITGRECAASEEIISFEGDARLCPNCALVYHKDHLPSACVTCEEPLGADVIVPDPDA